MIHSSKFESVIMAMICLNMLVMMIQHHGQSEQVHFTLNILFTIKALYVSLSSFSTKETSGHIV